MATEQQLKQALIKADRAGDTQAAQLFASKIKEIRSQQSSVAQPVPQLDQQNQGGDTSGSMVGALENVAAFGTSMIAEPLAGLAGIAQSINPFADDGAGADAVKSTREALTYQPRTKRGVEQQQSIGEALAPIGEAVSEVEGALGKAALDVTGSPALAAMAHSLPTAALELLGLKGSKHFTKIKAPSKKQVRKTLVESAPEINAVKSASRAIYKELDDSGVVINQRALARLENGLDDISKKGGIRERVTPEAYGAIQEVKKDIAANGSLTTSQMDELRAIAKNSIVPTDPNKARVGSMVVDEIDSFLDDIKSTDIGSGSKVDAASVGKKYKAARKLWGRAKRAEMLNDAIEMGSSRKAGVEKGIRNELNNLLNRKKSRKFLSESDVSAIRKVTDGDFKQNFASLIGSMGLKLDNSPSMFASIIGGGGLSAVASNVPGLTGAIAPIALGAVTVGTVAKKIAKEITKSRADFLTKIAASGNDAERVTKAYLSAVPKNKRKTSDLSDLLLDPNIDIDALEGVANEFITDAVNATRFKRELMQATAVLAAPELAAKDEAANAER